MHQFKQFLLFLGIALILCSGTITKSVKKIDNKSDFIRIFDSITAFMKSKIDEKQKVKISQLEYFLLKQLFQMMIEAKIRESNEADTTTFWHLRQG